MEISSTINQKFEPITVTILIETEIEYKTLRRLASANVTIPNAISESNFGGGDYSKDTLTEFLDGLREVLKAKEK